MLRDREYLWGIRDTYTDFPGHLEKKLLSYEIGYDIYRVQDI